MLERRPLRTACVLVVGLVAALSACSSSDRPRTIDNMLGGVAAASSGPGRIEGTLTTATSAPLTGGFDGSDTNGRGSVRSEISTSNGKRVPLEIRWLDGSVYIHRSAEPGQVTGIAGQFLNAQPDAAAWMQAGTTSYGERLVSPFVPGALATELEKAGGVTSKPGPEIDGEETTDYTSERPAGLRVFWSGALTTTLTVDGDKRVRRVSLTAGETKIAYDVTYGEKVAVEAPSAADLTAPPTTPVVLEPTGAFTTVAAGADNGVQWTLAQAPGTRGTQCWRLTATPPLAVQSPNLGKDTRCVAPPAADDDRTEQASFVLATDGAKETAVLAVVPPPGATQAKFGYIGGRTETVPVTSEPLVVAYSPDEPLVFVGFTGGGTPVDCGTGSVTHVGDIVDETLTGSGFGVAWTCQDGE